MRKSRSAASWAVAARPHWIKTLWTVCEVWDISEENNDHPAYVAGFRVRGAAREGETKGSCPVRSGDLQRARRGAEGPARHASHDSEIWLHGSRGFGIVRPHRRRVPAITGQSRELYGHTAAEFRQLLDKAGLHATSMMADYERLAKDVDPVAAEARTLGAEYVVCSTIPHKKQVTPENIARAAEDFDRWGEKLAASGLHLCYHTHGVEFGKSPDGTLFDTLVRRTNPKYVNYEMDIFWIVFAFQDPAKLLHKYPGRFPLMHVKDIRKDTVLGRTPADVMEEDSVPLGAGIVDIPATLRAARQTGVRHYYIEDEDANAAQNIPGRLTYLDTVR